MRLRTWLNQNSALVGLAAAIVLALAAFVAIRFGLREPAPTVAKVYFTADDGATFFADAMNKVAPFDHEGKEAVQAYVFTCSGGKPFVAYMRKFTPEGQGRIAKAASMADALEHMPPSHILNKRPGTGPWLPSDHPQASAMRRVGCPDGSSPDVMLAN